MITRSTSPDGSLYVRRAGGKGCATRILMLLLGLVALACVVVFTLWLLLLSPFGYTPPADAPGFGDGRPQPVFIYGSLRTASVRRLVIGRAIEAREAVLPGFRRERLNVVAEPQALTRGEVIEVQPAELRRLDRYERLGVRYERVWLPLDDGASAWVYRRIAAP